MGVKDRMTSGAARVSGATRELAAVHGDRLGGLRSISSGDDEQPLGIERFLVGLVRAVRVDEAPEGRTTRDVNKAAARRRQRLGALSFAAGPLAGVAGQLADLYCDTATVCDLAAVHDLQLTDEVIAAHMLVLWHVTEHVDEALSAVRGRDERGVAALVAARLRQHADAQMPDTLDKRGVIKALWQARGLVGDIRRGATTRPVKAVISPGKPAKQFVERAERQLGLRPPTSPFALT
jgi:hypothetical protein